MLGSCKLADPSVAESEKLKAIVKGIRKGAFKIIVVKALTLVAALL